MNFWYKNTGRSNGASGINILLFPENLNYRFENWNFFRAFF